MRKLRNVYMKKFATGNVDKWNLQRLVAQVLQD
jgi:hypothetical protein